MRVRQLRAVGPQELGSDQGEVPKHLVRPRRHGTGSAGLQGLGTDQGEMLKTLIRPRRHGTGNALSGSPTEYVKHDSIGDLFKRPAGEIDSGRAQM